LTSLAWPEYNDGLLCHAHSKGVRLIALV